MTGSLAGDGREMSAPARGWTRRELWSLGGLLCLSVFLAFSPCLKNGFVSWDDPGYLLDNPQINRRDGLLSIWGDVFRHARPEFRRPGGEARVAHQYYPVVFTIYWLEFRLQEQFGAADPGKTVRQNLEAGTLSPLPFHALSLLLHVLNALLVAVVLLRLGVGEWAAWVATLFFALHPMQVASVAWISERKNTLSLLFYLLSFLQYLELRRRGGRWHYLLSMVLFQVALLCKTAAATLPAVLFLTDCLFDAPRERGAIRKSLLRILPFLLLACLAASVASVAEDRGRTIPLEAIERPLVASRALLFYPLKMLLPIGQSPVYPLWRPDAGSWRWYLPVIVVLAATALLARRWKRLEPRLSWAIGFYLITQMPMVGWLDINYFQFSFVAEQYFYHGSIGLFLAAAIALDGFRDRLVAPPARKVFGLLVGTLALVAAVGTASYCRVWRNSESFWTRTLEINEKCWPAYYNLGNERLRQAAHESRPEGRAELLSQAAACFRRVLTIEPQIAAPYDSLIQTLVLMEDWKEGLTVAEMAVRRFPRLPRFSTKAGAMAYAGGHYEEAAAWFAQAAELHRELAEPEEARENYRAAADAAERAGLPEASSRRYRLPAVPMTPGE